VRYRFPQAREGDGSLLDKPAAQWHFIVMSLNKLDQLREWLRNLGSCLVAYSGGVDSVFLAYVAHQTLEDKALAVIGDTPSLPRRELEEALAIAEQWHFPVRVVRTGEFENPQYVANPENRCYFCKQELFKELIPLAREAGAAAILYGENASDVGDFRPGARAAAELQVRAPLKEIGITKEEIRQFSAALGLPTADKPQMACLSSRIPYGEEVTPAKLAMIETAENGLRDLGFREVRVRHHELKHGHLARIEVGPAEWGKFLADGMNVRAAQAIKKAGYQHVTLDLLGYRRGSMNEGLAKPVIA
jgi:pyridinium-3,5-biscarboxylic acid mononucleotide sulfurtransferase